ncbi:MAG TPA: PQQ-binding-like beta-propeller repeat protein [Vicinamibacterales bacterium]|nr:PQQ-binding-like beta-propeller repeat protein [Vicinamibacterales bacterium]
MSFISLSAARSLLAGTVGVLVAGGAALRGAQAPVPARAAMYTDAQAAAGESLYRRSCASCHGATLSGGTAPPLTGAAFESSWSDPRVTLADVFFIARTTMPPRASGTLTAPDHAAVFAYILKMNGFPAGATALTATSEQLEAAHLAIANRTAAPPPPEFIPGAAAAAAATSGPDQATLTRASQSTDWLLHTHDYGGTRFSPLREINVTTATRLTPACLFQVGERDNFQTGPIVYNGTMYITTTASTVALDASTCRVKWRHAWQPRETVAFQRNRGVAIKDGRVIRGTPDGYLLALNSETGAQLWARRIGRPAEGEIFVMAPILFEDLVLIGPALSERNVQGWVGAFRASDGTPVWRFNTIPQPGEPGFETWKNPKGIPMGGGAVWTSFALDTETGDLHLAVTNPAPDLPVHLRQGTNLYTNSMIVLDARTGKLRWYRQMVPNDSHDWDLTHATPMFSTTINGATRHLVVTTGKDGVLRALDRETHGVLYETPVTTRENAETPVITTPTRACPGVLGGTEWNGPAYNPDTNLLYVPAVDWCATFTAYEQVRFIPGKGYMGGRTDLDPIDRSQGWLTAIDASNGAVKWKYRSARPMVAAVTTTAGNIVMTGELTGDFTIFDATSGAILYRFNTGGPVGGGIVTYAVAGKQYVAVASGSPSNFWVERSPGAPTIIVFALPGSPAS